MLDLSSTDFSRFTENMRRSPWSIGSERANEGWACFKHELLQAIAILTRRKYGRRSKKLVWIKRELYGELKKKKVMFTK